LLLLLSPVAEPLLRSLGSQPLVCLKRRVTTGESTNSPRSTFLAWAIL